jgi:hypothetical protein
MAEPNNKIKTFWERPEGTTGRIGLVAVAGGLVYGLYQFLPYAITMLHNTLTAGLLLAGVIALWYVLTDKKIHAIFSYAYQGLMRGITGMLIDIDPISILRTYVSKLRKSLGGMGEQITNLEKQMAKLNRTIKDNAAAANARMTEAAFAAKKGADPKDVRITMQIRKAGKLEQSNITLQDVFTRMEVLLRVLRKMRDNCEVMIDDIEFDIKVKDTERTALAAGSSALRSAMNILKGDPNSKGIYDQAMDKTMDDINDRLGEVQSFMEQSSSYMDSIDLQNNILDEEGMKRLEDWLKQSDSKILGAEKPLLIQQAHNSSDVIMLSDPAKKWQLAVEKAP